MNGSGLGGGPTGGGLGGGGLDLFHDSVSAQWPLIRYLLDDPVYRAAYRTQVEELLNTVFEPLRVSARIQAEYARVAPYVVGREGEQAGRTFLASPDEFMQAISSLLAYVQSRGPTVRRALETAR